MKTAQLARDNRSGDVKATQHLGAFEDRISLAFGQRQAVLSSSLLEFAENTRHAVPSLIDYDTRRPQGFYCWSSFAQVNGIRMFSAFMPNVETLARVGGESQPTFVFHIKGECFFEVEAKAYAVRPNLSAVFFPEHCPWVVDTVYPSTVVISIDKSQLEATARTMLAEDFRTLMMPRFKNPAQLNLQFGSVSFDQSWQQICLQIDAYSGNEEMLALAGLDDLIYRNLALTLAPDVFAKQSEMPVLRAGARQLNRVCEFVEANLANRITLTDLERIGHMSRRTLHNAFLKAYGLSPMAWVREQRLLQANRKLKSRSLYRSVSEVLFGLGFTNSSLFASQYFRRFGELPSTTFAKHAAKE